MTVTEASAAWEVEQVAGELRETYLAVAAATVLLERTSAGCAHPAIRHARRRGDDALDLAADAERQLSDGASRLRTAAGQPSIGDLVEVLDTARDQFGAAAARVGQLPARITTARQQLAEAGQPDLAAEAASGQWSRAAEQLDLMAESLTAAVEALTSYTEGLSGATT
ncbi:hypothetical protein AB0I89_20500 [Micromonospora sp. NPDC049801]|uniref:hypothetical protein n=1 Tax=unclassified Micromonospora TaxID=2617518 RepID=UPI0033EDE98A